MQDNARAPDRPAWSEDPVCQWAERWNQEYRAWEAAMGPARPATAEGPGALEYSAAAPEEQRTPSPARLARFTEAQSTLIEQLGALLAEDLRKEAQHWRYRWIAPDIESRAMALFGAIVLALPKLHIDSSQNVRLLLLLIAKRRAIDEYGNIAPPPNASSAAASMAPVPGSDLAGLDNTTLLAALADPESVDAEDCRVTEIDRQIVLRRVWAYWERLAPPDNRIMRLRWQSDPPRPFASIAQQLGQGWTPEAVRKRHERALEKTRQYLREHGIRLD
jgi:hypothetical protein